MIIDCTVCDTENDAADGERAGTLLRVACSGCGYPMEVQTWNLQ